MRRLLNRLPIRPEVWSLLGEAAAERQHARLARAMFQQALDRTPHSALAHASLAAAEYGLQNLDEAEALCRRALELDPASTNALNNLGTILERRNRFGEAMECYQAASREEPVFVTALMNRAALEQKLGDYADARKSYQEVLRASPGNARARFHMALMHLQHCEWEAGWREYDSRFEIDEAGARSLQPPLPGVPLWQGEDLRGKRILLRAEQGLGDTIQFARFARVLSACGAAVVLSVQPPLVKLLTGVQGVELVCALGGERSAAAVDYWSPLLSVPRWLNVTDAGVAAEPYLTAPPDLQREWAQRLARHGEGLRVGIAWAGNRAHDNDRFRSLAPQDLAPLGQAGCRFFDLGREPLPESGLAAVPLGGGLHDFADSAAVMANLDLVISVDTAVAHLAGALGRPVWVLLPSNSDWRWFLDRDDSPWYRSARLYRQRRLGDWSDVIARVAHDLSAAQAGRRAEGS